MFDRRPTHKKTNYSSSNTYARLVLRWARVKGLSVISLVFNDPESSETMNNNANELNSLCISFWTEGIDDKGKYV